MERELTWLLDIVQESRRAQEIVEGVEYDRFITDWKIHYVAVRCIEVIGEAATRFSDEFRGEYPNLPWSQMIGMRNTLIHQYHRVDLETVWNVIHDDLPGLIAQIAPLIPPEEGG